MTLRPLTTLTAYAEDLFTDDQLTAHTRTGGSVSEQIQLRAYCLAAMDYAEQFCRQPLFRRAFELTGVGAVRDLPGLGLISVSGITYQYQLETAVTLATTDYLQHGNRLSYYLTSKAFGSHDVLRVTYEAGVLATEVPESIRQAVLLMTEDFYNNRADSVRDRESLFKILLNSFVYRT